MKRRPIAFNSDELAFIEALATLPRCLLHAEFVHAFQRHDVEVSHIKALCTRNGWNTRAPWTAEEDATLRAHFADMPSARVAAMIGRTLTSVNQRAYKFGLTKSAEYLASPEACRLRRGDQRGASSRFVKGQVAHNKGVKRPAGWAPGRIRESQFTPGQAGWNWKPIGSERVISGYRYTKIADERRVPYTRNWKASHVLRWEALHGPIPAGHALKNRDGNRQNTDPDNWQLVSRAMLPRLSGARGGRLAYDDAPDELKPTIMAVAQLEHVARKRSKERAA